MNLVKDKINSIKTIQPTKKGIFQSATGFVLDALYGKYDKKIIVYVKNIKTNENIEVFEDVPFLESISVEHTNKYTEHPIENGKTITDHFINNPVIIKATMLFDVDDTINRSLLISYFKNGTFLSMKVGGEYFDNLVISGKPYEIKTDAINKYFYNITFKEVLIADTQFLSLTSKKVKNKKNVSTSNVGNKQAEDKKSLFYSMAEKMANR